MRNLGIAPGKTLGWAVYGSVDIDVLQTGQEVFSDPLSTEDWVEIRHELRTLMKNDAYAVIIDWDAGDGSFGTHLQIGRIIAMAEEIGNPWYVLRRSEIELALCGRAANSGEIKAWIRDWVGSGWGTDENPGSLYGVTGKVWPALAAAIAGAKIGLDPLDDRISRK